MICLERHDCCEPKCRRELRQTPQPFPPACPTRMQVCDLYHTFCPYPQTSLLHSTEHSSILQNPLPLEVFGPFASLWQSVKMKKAHRQHQRKPDREMILSTGRVTLRRKVWGCLLSDMSLWSYYHIAIWIT